MHWKIIIFHKSLRWNYGFGYICVLPLCSMVAKCSYHGSVAWQNQKLPSGQQAGANGVMRVWAKSRLQYGHVLLKLTYNSKKEAEWHPETNWFFWEESITTLPDHLTEKCQMGNVLPSVWRPISHIIVLTVTVKKNHTYKYYYYYYTSLHQKMCCF